MSRGKLPSWECRDFPECHAASFAQLVFASAWVVRQRPGSAKGLVFLTIEDEHGVANLVVFAQVARQDRAALVSGRLLIAEGRVEREVEHAEMPIIHLIVRRLLDRSDTP